MSYEKTNNRRPKHESDAMFTEGLKDNKRPKKEFVKKPKKNNTIKKRIPLGRSKIYDNNVSEIYNLLDSITFDKVCVPVYMSKQLAFGDESANGNISIGSVDKFTQDEFTINVSENFIEKIKDNHVILVRCRCNHKTGEFTYVDGLYVVEGTPLTSYDEELLSIFGGDEEE